MEIYRAAVQSVEDWIAVNKPQFANGAWMGKVPEDDLGYNANSWSPHMNEIRAGFEQLAGVEIDFPAAQRRRTVSWTLFAIANVLVRKAEDLPVTGPSLVERLSQ